MTRTEERIIERHAAAFARQLTSQRKMVRDFQKQYQKRRRAPAAHYFKSPMLPALEWRELLIREASFSLWRQWWPLLPEPHLRAAIAGCSLAVLVYCAHQRLGEPFNARYLL
jgi:hypothetical protein